MRELFVLERTGFGRSEARWVARGARRGAVAPFVALMMVPIMAMMCFSVDLAWILKTQGELQNVADAAALAGATAHLNAPPTYTGGGTSPGAPYGLMDGFVLYHTGSPTLSSSQILSTAETNSQLYAQYYAYQNSAGAINNITLANADVTFGFLHSDLVTYDEPPATGTFPNTVHVKVRMDGTSNPALPLFFSPVLGMSTKSLTADAYATIFNGPIVSFNGGGGLLPLALDQNYWSAYLQYLNSGSPASANVTMSVAPASSAANTSITYQLALTADSSGFQQMQVFPAPDTLGTAGRGWLSLNNSSVSDSSLQTWATSGISSTDLAALTNSTSAGTVNDVLLPLPSSGNGNGVSAHDMTSWDWQADPGEKANIPGMLPLNTPVMLPLFQPVNPNPSSGYQAGTKGPDTGYSAANGDNANGSNLNLNVVAFVPVIITNNSGKNVYVEPTAMVPPGAIFGSLTPADSTSSSFYASFSIPRLTRPGG